MTSSPNAHQFSFEGLDGSQINMADYAGKVVLVVNTASKCGFTPQYQQLQMLYEDYQDQGLVVLGVPSADFGGQEFDTADAVQKFTADKFQITFPLAAVSTVKGANAHPFYKWAKGHSKFLGSPKWNFHKYLIGKDGQFITWFASTTKPNATKVQKAIQAAIDAP